MPTIRKWFLLKSFAAVVAFVLVIVAIHTIQSHRIPTALMHQATRAQDEGKPDRAVHYLRYYLEFVPDDLSARVQMATLLKARPDRNPYDQLRLYEQILRQDPNQEAIRREALTLATKLGRSTDATVFAGELLKQYPNEAELHLALAQANSALQKSDEAIQNYEAAISAKPDDVEIYQRYLSYLLNDAKRPQAALEVLKRLTANVPRDARTWITRAKFAQMTGQPELKKLATADVRQALSIDPTFAEGYLMLAEIEQREQHFSEARDALSTGLKHHPEDVKLIRALAWLDLNLGNIGAAVMVLERGLEHGKNSFELLGPLGDLLVQLGETERAEKLIQQLETKPRQGTKLQVSYLRARLAMRAGLWAEATEMLTTLRNDAVSLTSLEQQCHFLLAVCHQKRGRIVDEQEALKLVLNKDPNNLAARTALAQSYMNQGRFRDAITEYEHAVQTPKASPGVHAMLVRLKMRELTLAGNTRPLEWATIDRVITELIKVYGSQSSDAVILRIESLVARQDTKQATTYLRNELVRRPADTKLWATLAELTAQTMGTASGLALLDEAQAAAGDCAELRLKRAELIAEDPLRSGTASIDRLQDQVDSWPDNERSKLFFGLAEIYDRLGADEGVIACYRRLVAERPTELTFHEALVDRLLRMNKVDEAKAAHAQVKALDPRGKSEALFQGRLACLTQDRASMTQALARLQEVFSTEPDRADVSLVMAELYRQSGEVSQQAKYIERAVRMEPARFPPMAAYLGYLTTRPSDDALRAILERLDQDPRWQGDATVRLLQSAGKLCRQQGNAKGSALLFATYASRPANAPYMTAQRADLAFMLGLPAEAQDYAVRAAQQPQPRTDDFQRLIMRHGADPRATLEVARKSLPPSLFLQTVAGCVEASEGRWAYEIDFKNSNERKQWIQHRLNYKLARYDRTSAIALLEQSVSEKKLEGDDLVWCQRNLAMLWAVRGQGDDRKKAVQILTTVANAKEETAEEKRNAAAVLIACARHLDGDDRRVAQERAVSTLEALVAQTRFPRDRFLLAQVYRSVGNRKAVVESINQLLVDDPKNLDYLLMGMEETIELGTPEAAKPFADRLTALHSTDFRALSAVARWHVVCGRVEQGYRIAENYSRTAVAAVGDGTTKSARTAELLDELVRLPQTRASEFGKPMIQSAIDRFESLIPLRAEAAVAAAGLYAFAGRQSEATAMIRKHKDHLSPNLRAAAGLAVLRAGGASERDFADVQVWLTESKQANPRSLVVLLNDGEFALLKQDFVSAERAYRAALELDPKNTIALNNLAWMLAPRPEASVQANELINRAIAEMGLTPELQDTRARIRIAERQFELAEKDLREALTQQKTPLRMFHLALAKEGRTSAKDAEVHQVFRQAKEKGLEPRNIHPADMPTYRRMDADLKQNPS